MRSMLRTLTGCALISTAVLGCAESVASSAADPIERPGVPESQFKPAGVEDTIDVLAGELSRAEASELKLSVALGGADEPWVPVRDGVERAFAELGVDGVVTAPSESEQADFVKREREELANGIGVAPLASALQGEVERARQGGIPVVTIENDLVSERELFVGFGQYEIGERIGDVVTLAQDLRVGNVIVLGADDEDVSRVGYLRSMGAKSVLEEAGFSVIIRNSSAAADGEARDVEMLKDDLLGDPRPLAMLGVFETSYRVALAAEAAERSLAAEDAAPAEERFGGLVRFANVPFVAYGFEPVTQDALRAGMLLASLVERRHYMGYLVPYILSGFNLLGVERTKYILTPHLLDDGTLDVGMDVVRPDALDAYLEFQELLAR